MMVECSLSLHRSQLDKQWHACDTNYCFFRIATSGSVAGFGTHLQLATGFQVVADQ